MPLLASAPTVAHHPESLAPDIARMQAEPGAYLDLALLYGLRPDLYAAVGKGYDAYFRNIEAALTVEERELVAWLVSIVSSSTYAAGVHAARIEGLGIAADVLEAVRARDLNADCLTHRQRAFLNFARKMAAFPHTIVDKDIIYLKANGFDDAAILELAGLSSYVLMLGTMSNAFFKVGLRES
ncbi:MAG: hypothetical protein ABI743_08430 [bacterium]